MTSQRLNLDGSRYDLNSFYGRCQHFKSTTDPLKLLASETELQRAKEIVQSYKAGTGDKSLTEDEIWSAKELYESAFHPQTGEKLFFMGRMSFMVPRNMVVIGGMMAFYKSTPMTIFWQFANQAFNALTNYTYRNASAGVSNEQLATAFTAATTASVGMALFFNRVVAKSPLLAGSIVGRFVPLIAVSAAHCVNIPLMRQQEIKKGIVVADEDGSVLGHSSQAAKLAIAQVIPGRIGMVAPSMVVLPILMSKLEKTAMFVKNPWLKVPTTILLTGISMIVTTPVCCAFFPASPAIKIEHLENHIQDAVRTRFPEKKVLYYYKGL